MTISNERRTESNINKIHFTDFKIVNIYLLMKNNNHQVSFIHSRINVLI